VYLKKSGLQNEGIAVHQNPVNGCSPHRNRLNLRLQE
jgi:hypothetical protein